MKEFKTYGEYIEHLKNQINDTYELCGWLRDSADLNEKDFYNALRKRLGECDTLARQLDRKAFENGRTDMKI